MAQNLLSIRQISEKLSFSKPTIAKKIKALGIEPQKEKGAYYLTYEQAQQIAESLGVAFDEAQDAKETDKQAAKEEKPNDDYLPLLKKQCDMLQEQLVAKDKQIEELQKTVDSLIDTNKALSASIAANEAKGLLIDADAPKEETKKSFWKRLFG